MTKEKQFQAIAKLHGWKKGVVERYYGRPDKILPYGWTYPDGWFSSNSIFAKAYRDDRESRNLAPPDYLNNRDAVAEVLEHLKNSKEYPHFQEDYVKNLRTVVERDLLKAEPSRPGVHWFEVCCATAEQMCEAILWATNKYTNE